MLATYYTHQGTELAGIALGLVFALLLLAWWKAGERADRRSRRPFEDDDDLTVQLDARGFFRGSPYRPFDQEID